jgi:hypothetical protein
LSKRKGFRAREEGNVALMMGIVAPALVGALGLGAEVTYWQLEQRSLQSAADAAAYSGAGQLSQNRSLTDIKSAASAAAYASGLHATRGLTPVVHSPPVSGKFIGESFAVEVVLTENVPRLFTGVFLEGNTTKIAARSVATTAGARPSCVLALNGAAAGAVTFSGSSTLELDGCDIASNSIANDAVDFSGATSVRVGCVSAVGEVEGAAGRLTLEDCAEPFTDSRLAPDPFEDRTVPTAGPCDTGLRNALNNNPSTVVTVSPGTICSNVGIKGEVTFSPGVYIFDNADISVNSTATLRGTDVTLVLLNGAEIKMNGGADIQLIAPDDPNDPLAGMVIMSDGGGSNVSHTLNGNSATSFQGAVYLPGSHVQFSGSNVAAPGACTLLVADTIEFTGNSFFGSDCTALSVSRPETAQVVLIAE